MSFTQSDENFIMDSIYRVPSIEQRMVICEQEISELKSGLDKISYGPTVQPLPVFKVPVPVNIKEAIGLDLSDPNKTYILVLDCGEGLTSYEKVKTAEAFQSALKNLPDCKSNVLVVSVKEITVVEGS